MTSCCLPRFLPVLLAFNLDEIRGIGEIFQTDEILLDAPRRYEAVEDRHAPGLVIGSTRARTAKRLLSDNGSCALLVVVDVAGGVA